jgi:hypothetical protein
LKHPYKSRENKSSLSLSLVEVIQAADTLLNDLVRLAVTIRKASTDSHNSKADASFKEDAEVLRPLKEHLTHVLLSRPERLDEARRKFFQGLEEDFSEKSNDERSKCLLKANADLCNQPFMHLRLTKVQERLVRANLRRNHRYRYSQTHALKVEQGSRQAVSARAVNSLKRSQDVANLADGPIADTVPKLGQTSNTEGHQTDRHYDTILSETTASQIDPDLMKTTVVAPSQQSGTAASAVTTRIKAYYPHPPKLGRNLKIVRCPCCCVTLEEKDLVIWRFVNYAT